MSHPTSDNQALAKTFEKPQTTSDEYLKFVQEKRNAAAADASPTMIVADDKMKALRDVIAQISGANVPVLITGESGTGKEVIARTIHDGSSRKDKPFVAINCAALPSNLLESELFGYERGAFTGAHQRHLGKFEQAQGGTLLLDEVTEIEPALQAKLLRALQEKEIERIGGSGPVSVDVRIIATTNRDIVGSVADGSFRQDLYYRLYVIHLEVPALRERPADIQALTQHFLTEFRKTFDREIDFTSEAMKKLLTYSWPGNVRELQNVIQRAVIMAKGTAITSADLTLASDKIATAIDWVKSLPIGKPLYDVETQFILETLKHHRGNRTHAAKTLGISLRTLRNKINEFSARGIEVMQPSTGKSL